jgi:hypothetical protein
MPLRERFVDLSSARDHRAGRTWQEALRTHVATLRRRYGPGRRILLVQAPQFLFETVNPDIIRNRGYYAYPPTGLQSLATSLSARDVAVAILDLNLCLLRYIAEHGCFEPKGWLQPLDAQVRSFKPDVIGVTCLTVNTDLFATHHPLTDILRHLRERGGPTVIIGGATATNEMARYVGEGLCHFGVEGEGEDRLQYLLDLLNDPSAFPGPISGICFPSEGGVRRTEGLCHSVELRGDLTASYRMVDVEAYCQVGSLNPYSRMAGRDTVYGVFQLNRGCRANRRFCGLRPFMGKRIRPHAVEEVLREVRYLVEERSVRHFEVLDDDFLADRAAVTRLLEGLSQLRREYPITWAANNGLMTQSITDALLDLMRDPGRLGFKIGIESGNPEMLARIRKPGTLESFARVATMLEDYPELFVGGNYIIGLFGEERLGQMLETFALSVRLNLDWSSFTVFQFTSKPNTAAENLKTDGVGATDFIPGKDTARREIEDDRSLALGADVFSLPVHQVPSRVLTKNIWLTFNLLGNYIGNKNLRPGGRPEKFVSWLDAVRVAYPQNPYMLLFAGLGRTLLGESDCADALLRDARTIVDRSPNWQYRFAQFGLDGLLEAMPLRADLVFEQLGQIWERCVPRTCRALTSHPVPLSSA